MADAERNPVDTVAEFLHAGSPPLNADDAAIAILDALVHDGFLVLRAEVHTRAVRMLDEFDRYASVDDGTSYAGSPFAAEVRAFLDGASARR